MINTNEDYRKRILSDDRQLRIKAAFKYNVTGDKENGEGIVLTGEDHLVEMEINELVNSEDTITMGSACSSKLTIKLIEAPRGIDYERSIIEPAAGVAGESGDIEYVDLGRFYVSEVKTGSGGNDMTITAYDSMCLLDKEYGAAISSFPVSVGELAEEIASVAGVNLKEGIVFPEYEINFVPEDVTLRQMVCYIAGLMGCFARFDRNGDLEFAWYEESDLTAKREDQYLNGFVRTLESEIEVTGIVSGTDDNAFSRGTGAGGTIISFDNPYVDEEMIDDIWKSRIANTSERIISAVYSGEAEEEGFAAVYSEEGVWDIEDEYELHSGDILIVDGSASRENAPDKVMVKRVNLNSIELVTLKGEELDEAEAGARLQLNRVKQWICSEMPDERNMSGNVLRIRSSAAGNEGDLVRVSGMNEENNELILMKVNGDALYGMAAGVTGEFSYDVVEGYRMSYLPCELRWRGDMAVQAGDIIYAEDENGVLRKLPVMSQTIKLGGGLEMECICEGDIETDAAFSSSKAPTLQRISKVYSSLQETIRDVSNKLTGKAGGFVSFGYDDGGKPNALYISDSEDVDTADHLWIWDSMGLRFKGPDGSLSTAITKDGEIVGDLLAANTVMAKSIAIDEVIAEYNESGRSVIDASHIMLGTDSLEKAIKASVSSTGGSNLIYNSTGAVGPFDDWYIGEDTVVEYVHGEEASNRLISQRAFRIGKNLTGGYLRKTIPVSVQTEYTFSFQIKNDISDITVKMDGAEVDISGYDLSDWTLISHAFTAQSDSVELVIESSRGGAMIGDIMLCAGPGTTWSQAPNEIFGTNVTLTRDRLEIAPSAEESDGVKTEITSSGMEIVNNRNRQDVIAAYTNDGTETKALKSRGQISSGRARLIPIDENDACMLIISD